MSFAAKLVIALSLAAVAVTALICLPGITPHQETGQVLEESSSAAIEETADKSDPEARNEEKPASNADGLPDNVPSNESNQTHRAPVLYPIAWLAIPQDDIPAGVSLQVKSLPGFTIVARSGGIPYGEATIAQSKNDGTAIVSYHGNDYEVPASHLLVNLPHLLEASTYDIVYSYSATSRCSGLEIPGLTGVRLDGYADGKQRDDYLSKDEFAVPCAYDTALKLVTAEKELMSSGYAFQFYDVYRPYRASIIISQAFSDAYAQDPMIQSGTGGWSLTWYAANGPSGHNFGTDVDVGICYADTGEPAVMPSHFDAFDESGHLSVSQLGWQNLNEGNYRQEVLSNGACMALHRTLNAAGFQELASEWWHFGDASTEAEMQVITGYNPLDFEALLND